jgi:hypothetical protein
MLVANGSILSRKRWSKSLLATSQANIFSGKCDSVLASPIVGGAGLNCQSLNAVVFMSPLPSAAVETQCKGTASAEIKLTIGRIARSGQQHNEPKWTIIHCPDEPFDRVCIAMRDKRLTEAQAIFEVEQAEEERAVEKEVFKLMRYPDGREQIIID